MYINLGDTNLIFDIRNYDPEHSKEYSGDNWCMVSIVVENKYFRYKQVREELLLLKEIDVIKEELENLLNDKITIERRLSFVEPDLSMMLYPKCDVKNSSNLLYIKDGNEIIDIHLELEINLIDNKGVYTGQKYIISFNREKIKKLLDYLTSYEIQKHVENDEDYYGDEFGWDDEYEDDYEGEDYENLYTKQIKKLSVPINLAEEIFDDVIIERGKHYYYEGKVTSIEKLNDTYFAEVSGSDNYTISVKLDEHDNILELSCTCPCDFFCKHEYSTILEIRSDLTLKELICPKCKSEKIAKILWGKPAFTKSLEKAVKDKRIVLGGCVITGDNPEFHCNTCSYEFDLE